MQTKKVKELLKLMAENPDLPIYAKVNSLVFDENIEYSTGEIGGAEVAEFVKVNLYGKPKIIFKKDSDIIFEYLVDKDERYDIPPRELEEIRKRVGNLDWHKAIFVYVIPLYNLSVDKIEEKTE